MKKLLLTMLTSAALLLSGCQLITSSGDDSGSDKVQASVHGKVTLAVVAADPPAGSKVQVRIYQELASQASARSMARAANPDATILVPVTAAGTYSYSATGVSDGNYYAVIALVDSDGGQISTDSPTVSGIQVSSGAATVADVELTYSSVVLN